MLGIFDEKVNIFVKIDQIGLAKAKNSFHKVPKLISQMPKTHFFGILREWAGLDFAQKKSLNRDKNPQKTPSGHVRYL